MNDNSIIVDLTTRNVEKKNQCGMKKKRFTRRSSSDSFQNAKSRRDQKRKNKKKKRNKILVNPSLTRTITFKPTQHMLLAKIVPGLNLHIK
jgi:hypothetical protein